MVVDPVHPAGRFARMDGQEMIIEPTPIHSRSPWWRALRVAGLAAPAVLLVAVVGVGLAGPKPTPPPEASSLALASPPDATDSATDEAPIAAATPSPAAQVAFPTQFRSIAALRPSEVLASRMAGATQDVVVVAGYLGIDWIDLTCKDVTLGATGPWCERRGLILESPIVTLGNTRPGGRPPHLHLTFPIGVRIPDAVALTAGGAPGTTVPAVVVGRFAAGSTCAGNLQACDRGFVVDRVVWAAGVDYALTPLVDPRLAASRRASPFAVADRMGAIPLEGVLAWPDTIASLEPEAGAAASKAPRSEPVWFLRVIVGIGTGVGTSTGAAAGVWPREAIPRTAWILLDTPRMQVIASGPASTATGSGAASVTAPGG